MIATDPIFLADENATLHIGRCLAQSLTLSNTQALTFWLEGDLGAGKTALVRAVLHSLGHTGPVKSPTYSLIQSYDVADLTLHHLDLYRMTSPEEWPEAGFDELALTPALLFIEWPRQASPLTAKADVILSLQHLDNARLFSAGAATSRAEHYLYTLQKLLQLPPHVNPHPTP